jgi:hypothetical protein
LRMYEKPCAPGQEELQQLLARRVKRPLHAEIISAAQV